MSDLVVLSGAYVLVTGIVLVVLLSSRQRVSRSTGVILFFVYATFVALAASYIALPADRWPV